MLAAMATPQLSIIVPLLNEEQVIGELLAQLARQQQVDFELLLVDGGSQDRTRQLAQSQLAALGLSGRLLTGEAGRAVQLNAGAAAANGELLLFLHADSRFAEPDALATGVAMLAPAAAKQLPAAARFTLEFGDTDAEEIAFGYYYYQCKARLDRPETVHGDQGLLVTRAAWERGGPFDASLPLAEDTSFADRLRPVCGWQLIPRRLITSARRFVTEGLKQRQTLNALLLNFLAIGWDQFFQAAPQVYRQQGQNQQLDLRPWWQLISRLLREMPRRKRWRIWLETGRYVRDNAWQLALRRDTWRQFRQGISPGEGSNDSLQLFDLWLAPLLANPLGSLLAALLTRVWFGLAGRRLQL